MTTATNGNADVRPMTVARNARVLARDVLELTELQTELLKVDAQDWTKRLVLPLVLLCVALVVALGSVPVLLTSLAAALNSWLEIGHALSLLISGLVGLVAAVTAGVIGWQRLRGSFSVFGRSREEFQRNIRWLKRVLRR